MNMRGTAANEPVVSQAGTRGFRRGYARVFGDRKPQRGRWVYDAARGRFVPADEYVPPARAATAPILTGRCHEGQVAPDGTPINTRRKRAAWARESGCADYDDFKGAREKRKKELEARARGELKPDPQLREFIGRELYKRKIIL